MGGRGASCHASGITYWVLRSGGLKVRLAQVDCVGEFKGKGVAESLVMTKDDLEFEGTKGGEAISRTLD